jgi:hypothetical protein
MKKVILYFSLLLLVVFVAVRVVYSQNNKTQNKKQSTEVVAKCPGMTGSCNMKCSGNTGMKSCDPTKCKENGCDQAKCKEMGCTPEKCKAEKCNSSDCPMKSKQAGSAKCCDIK